MESEPNQISPEVNKKVKENKLILIERTYPDEYPDNALVWWKKWDYKDKDGRDMGHYKVWHYGSGIEAVGYPLNDAILDCLDWMDMAWEDDLFNDMASNGLHNFFTLPIDERIIDWKNSYKQEN